MFNPEELLDLVMEDSNDTKVIPVPIREYPAVVEKIALRPWTGKKDPTQSGMALDLVWMIDDPELKAELDREVVTIKQGIMLEMTEDGKGIAMGKGKNVGLGRLREALGLNTPGEPFSFQMLVGQMGRIIPKHRVVGEDIFAEVDKVFPMG